MITAVAGAATNEISNPIRPAPTMTTATVVVLESSRNSAVEAASARSPPEIVLRAPSAA
jgi:hypothetical protein